MKHINDGMVILDAMAKDWDLLWMDPNIDRDILSKNGVELEVDSSTVTGLCGQNMIDFFAISDTKAYPRKAMRKK